jgi:hypothetical protein
MQGFVKSYFPFRKPATAAQPENEINKDYGRELFEAKFKQIGKKMKGVLR